MELVSTTLWVTFLRFYLFYIPWPFPPVWGVADNTKETNKNNGGFTPFFQQWRGIQPSFDGTAGATQPILPVFHNLRRFIDAVSPTAPTTGLPLQGNPVATADANQNCVTIICHSFLFLARSLASLISIFLSFRALFTPSIHPNLGLPLPLLPSTFAFITFFSSRSLSILSTWPNHLKTFTSKVQSNKGRLGVPSTCLKHMIDCKVFLKEHRRFNAMNFKFFQSG